MLTPVALRSRLLSTNQYDDARQILRDIDSLDGHTSFLFGKINFLMDATVGFININQNKRVSKLTTISVVFVPLNIIAGIGGMSEFSMMTQGVSWPVAYGAFTVAMGLFGWGTFVTLRWLETRKAGESARGPSRQARGLEPPGPDATSSPVSARGSRPRSGRCRPAAPPRAIRRTGSCPG
ncbi:MAG: hypothetical protein IPL72_00840 [Sulfuritalea sp.]|nr:hypothetical protein [Sulfuritalea sp.]